MSTIDLDTFLLNNWVDLDAATTRGYAIEHAVFEALADEVRHWADQRGWSGVFTTELIWLSAPEWTTKTGSRPAADASFQFGYHGPEEDSFAVTSLTGLNQDVAGFDFHQTRLAAKVWKPKATAPELLAALPGFSLHSAGLCHPFRLEMTDILDAAAAGDYAHVAKPVTAVLDRLDAAAPILSELMGPRA